MGSNAEKKPRTKTHTKTWKVGRAITKWGEIEKSPTIVTYFDL